MSHGDVTAAELLDWFAVEIPLTDYERAIEDVRSGSATNLVVVVDHAGVIATVVDTDHGAVWRSAINYGAGPGRRTRSELHELLEWSGERPAPLRLIAGRRDEVAVVELEPDLVFEEVRLARASKKVHKIYV